MVGGERGELGRGHRLEPAVLGDRLQRFGAEAIDDGADAGGQRGHSRGAFDGPIGVKVSAIVKPAVVGALSASSGGGKRHLPAS